MAKRKTTARKKAPRPAVAKPKAPRKVPTEPLGIKATLAWTVGLALLAVLLYMPSHDYAFVYDDDAVIADNVYVKEGFGGLGKIWTTTYFQGYNENINARAYRPVPLSTLAIERALFDEPLPAGSSVRDWTPNPHIYHKTSLLYYGLAIGFLLLFMSKLLRSYHPFIPIAITLLFALHPIHLEVVANIKSRDTILGFMGWAAAAWMLLKFYDKHQWAWLGGALVAYAIGLFSKEEILTTVAIIPVLLFIFRKEKPLNCLLYLTPFLVVAGIYLSIRTGITGGLNEGVKLTELDNSLLAADGPAERIPSNLKILGLYLWQSIWPNVLISDYSYGTVPNTTFADWRPWVSLIAYLGLIGAAFYGVLKRTLYGFGAFYYLVAISIFSSIVITNVSIYNDRFLFNGVLGICCLVGYGLHRLLKPKAEGIAFFQQNWLPIALLAVLAALCVIKITNHLPYWQDRYALFSHDVAVAPNNARMLKNHGGSLARLALAETDPVRKKELAREGVEVLERALASYNRMATGHVHLANLYFVLDDYNNAERSFKNALAIDTNNKFAKTNLANVYGRQGNYAAAIDLLNSIDQRLWTKNDYTLAAWLHRRNGDDALAAKYSAKAN